MNQQVSREDFLRALEEVKPGLSQRDILEQSAAFAFTKGRVWTFNDEVCCSAVSGLPPDFTGVVRAKLLLDMVRKADDETLTVTDDGQEFRVNGKKWRGGFARDSEVLLDLKKVPKPAKEDWFPVAPDLCEAIQLVQECAGKDQQQFVYTCVHLHPKWVEASDNNQLARFRVNTGLKESVLVRRDSIKFVPTYDITRMAVHDNWVHFRASNATVISITRFADKFYDLTAMLDGKGVPVQLPKTLSDLALRAKTVSDETEEDQIKVKLLPGKVLISARCDGGWFEAGQAAKYSGPQFSFLVSPKMLQSLVDKYPDCSVDMQEYRIRASGGKFKYVACLDATVTNEPPKTGQTEE